MSTTPPPGTPPTPSASPYPPPRQRKEKDEKDEKDRRDEEKQHEKDEKEHDEKWRRDPLGAVIWALILIWAGVVLLGNNLQLLPTVPGMRLSEWSWIFAGAGVLLLCQVVIRLIMPEYRRGVIGNLILAFIALGVGLGDALGPGIIWGLLLVAVGAALVVGGILRR